MHWSLEWQTGLCSVYKVSSQMIRATSKCSGKEMKGEELLWHLEVTGGSG